MDAPFQGFPDTMAFLADLAANNDRTWFAANKACYERDYRQPAEAFVAELRPRLEALVGGPVIAKVFRISGAISRIRPGLLRQTSWAMSSPRSKPWTR